MTNPLQSIPARARQALYLVYALVGLGLAVASVYGVDVTQHAAALAVVGAAFGFTAAANISPGSESRRRDETGAIAWRFLSPRRELDWDVARVRVDPLPIADPDTDQ